MEGAEGPAAQAFCITSIAPAVFPQMTVKRGVHKGGVTVPGTGTPCTVASRGLPSTLELAHDVRLGLEVVHPEAIHLLFHVL
jgi:hypothetical protein